jgi:hypothetical protein
MDIRACLREMHDLTVRLVDGQAGSDDIKRLEDLYDSARDWRDGGGEWPPAAPGVMNRARKALLGDAA